jgi:hypothetical protein
MPFGSVKVNGPADRDVYVNGNYEEAAGETGEIFVVEFGENKFETLDDEFRIDNRAVCQVNAQHPNREVMLAAVVPPEPTRVGTSGAGNAPPERST